jgi:hypothetical protein
MVRGPVPQWLMIALSIGGLMIALAIYGGLSARQTALNETQSVLPGIKGMAEGFTKIVVAGYQSFLEPLGSRNHLRSIGFHSGWHPDGCLSVD